ncbi:hypothetical protein I1A62_02720 (plasmid) [Rhodococcus sp. USK10]|uniref:hypothetical protein n=1 Tax=Rhodococcus sp. USK10 TaxID=2789739 RepID=UPI001C607966|nr:hypothetical protein [Rhodococcus sp. USK10]QYB00045.1 hypothetical protein I1A62_02720 [Rhodococcus sp. USK10]
MIDTLGPAPTATTPSGRRATTASPGGPAATNAPTDQLPPQKSEKTGQRRFGAKSTIGAVTVLVAVGAVGWTALRVHEPENTTPAAPEATQQLETGTIATAANSDPAEGLSVAPDGDANQCHSDRGDQKTGTGVIAAFEHAYYVLRSGHAARALTAPGSPLPTADKIQAGIDTVPIGTNYCLRTIETINDHYTVVLTEMRPGEPAMQFTQTITTTHIDGRWLIDVIA